MKNVIVTEKPSVARDYARVLGVSGNHDGYIENADWIITWCVGHLIEMEYPEKYDPDLKNWKAETLPFLPKEYRYSVIPSVKKQFDTIKGIYHRQDIGCIYYAGDSAREGIYIQMLVRQEAGTKRGVDERVVWLDSFTDAEILRGIREAKPVDAYKNLTASGYERAIEDYALGINYSRALTLKYGDIVNRTSGKRVPIAAGRVMTCVLGMVVENDRAYRSFVPTDFYKPVLLAGDAPIKAAWKAKEESPYYSPAKLYKDTGFKEEKDAKNFIASLPPQVHVRKSTRTQEKKYAPPLYNLADLQADGAKKLKLSPDETLAFAQSLYEKKMLTYPRTDANVLSTAVAKEIGSNVRGLTAAPEFKDLCSDILESNADKHLLRRYVDDSKIEDHYALIPTGQTQGFSSLHGDEKEVYLMVVKRFLSIFYPPAVYDKYEAEFDADGETFTAQVKVLADEGWYKVTGIPKADMGKEAMAKSLSSLKEGIEVSARYMVEAGQTKPPERYTSGSIITAMKGAGKMIEDPELRAQLKGAGIGTSATRAAVLVKLEKDGYISCNKKTQILTAPPLGEAVYETVRLTCPQLLSPEMTASWEQGLSGIAEGKVPPEVYREKMETSVTAGVRKILNNDASDKLTQLVEPLVRAAGNPKQQPYAARNGNPAAKGSAGGKTIYVPYEDKDEAKAAGARWDSDKKSWYAPKGADMKKFAKWLKKPDGWGKKDTKNTGTSTKFSSAGGTPLKVPYDDKDEAKAAGARWDSANKTWYAPKGADLNKFKKWT